MFDILHCIFQGLARLTPASMASVQSGGAATFVCVMKGTLDSTVKRVSELSQFTNGLIKNRVILPILKQHICARLLLFSINDEYFINPKYIYT